MKLSNFTTTVHAKWILAGEHAVLRGFPAIVFPIPSQQLQLVFSKNQNNTIQPDLGDMDPEYQALVWKLVRHGFDLVKKPLGTNVGFFDIYNQIPIGMGFGFSAAICAAISRWFAWMNIIEGDSTQIFGFAKKLEKLFHGESSGLDIIGVTTKCASIFTSGVEEKLNAVWRPIWFLSHSKPKNTTSASVREVQNMYKKNSLFAQEIDRNMGKAVLLAVEALRSFSKNKLIKLSEAITIANQCFENWGLITNELAQDMKELLNFGAISVKPTGAGKGGAILSLWDKMPPEQVREKLILI